MAPARIPAVPSRGEPGEYPAPEPQPNQAEAPREKERGACDEATARLVARPLPPPGRPDDGAAGGAELQLPFVGVALGCPVRPFQGPNDPSRIASESRSGAGRGESSAPSGLRTPSPASL